ncbi:DNA primase small subunit [[Candida] railenensis]|uniref:DNA primase n=1 Tax=[Candida] railenensis TaxID=45579 RepID=A0A9P0VXS6_9ASCO|nr:DNA primase small subunit [[Candida] railenensis]
MTVATSSAGLSSETGAEDTSSTTLENTPTLQSFTRDSENDADGGAPAKKRAAPSSSDMLFYYERLLPFRYIFQWLNHSPKPSKDFTMREFAFEFRSGAYQRYNSFSNQDDFKKSVVNANPMRFEVGAVYSANPKERKNLPKSALKPLSKELVFDIDLTDYDDIRTCCSGTAICTKCWKFIQVATKIMDASLREDFGFNHLIWIFSGRRGAHCWVSDKRARALDENSRKSIVEYLDVVGKHNVKSGKLNLKKPYHPHIERSFNILKDQFATIILREQDPWNTYENNTEIDKKLDELLSFLPEKALQEELRKHWKSSSSNSLTKWEDINVFAKRTLKSQLQVNMLNDAKKDVILYFMYPRLDMEVSKQVIHLLKSPFCIHPGTGNVCVPFDPLKSLVDNDEDSDYGFNPMTAPNLGQLQTEIENWTGNGSTGSNSGVKTLDYEKTSLKPYVDYFAKFVNGLNQEELSVKRERDASDKLDF